MTKKDYERLKELANEIKAEKRTWHRVWFFGGDKKDTSIDDYVTRYKSNKGEIIEVNYSFTNINERWYTIKVGCDKVLGTDEIYFDTLKEAKAYFEEV